MMSSHIEMKDYAGEKPSFLIALVNIDCMLANKFKIILLIRRSQMKKTDAF